MPPTKGSTIAKATIAVLVLAGIVLFVVTEELEIKARKDADLVARTEICANVCVREGSEWHKVYRQKLGFGSFEWRCGCLDGHVQAVP